MAIIHFDQAQRREYKEPQTTKKELLKPPTHTAYGDDWNTPRSASSIADRVADTASWSFDNLRSPEGRSASFDAPTKVEAASPMPGVDHQRRPFGLDDTQAHAEQEKRDSPLAAGRGVSGSSPDDKYGRKSGVIDLTADDSEDEQDMAVPERQFVPRAEDDSDVARLQRPKPPSPPRTFTRGLAPIAAHPRKAPIVHRSKPPIKPHFQRQINLKSSPAPANKSHSVFNQPHRPIATARQANEIHMAGTRFSSSSVRTLEGTPLGDSTDSMSKSPVQEQAHNSDGPRKAAGPFLEDDDTGNEEDVTASKKTNIRASVDRLTKRPRNDTPARNRYDEMVKHSAEMREESRRAREDAITRANTVVPGTDDTTSAAFNSSGSHSFLGPPHQR
jgi:hypothetical protein